MASDRGCPAPHPRDNEKRTLEQWVIECPLSAIWYNKEWKGLPSRVVPEKLLQGGERISVDNSSRKHHPGRINAGAGGLFPHLLTKEYNLLYYFLVNNTINWKRK